MQNLVDQTCRFTGHRQLSEEIVIDLQRSLEKEIVQMMHAGICCFCAVGAVDLICWQNPQSCGSSRIIRRFAWRSLFHSGGKQKIGRRGNRYSTIRSYRKQTESYAYRNCMIGDVCR